MFCRYIILFNSLLFLAACVAAELSLGAAIISGDFAKAHKLLARDTSKPIDLTKDTLEEAFEKAQALVVKISTPPSKDKIMRIYGLYKQATVGDVNICNIYFTKLLTFVLSETWIIFY